MSDSAKATGERGDLTPPPVADQFLGTAAGRDAYERATAQAATQIVEAFATADSPYSGRGHERVRERLADVEALPSEGADLETVLGDVAQTVLADAVRVHDDACVAHLQCPPAVPALAAEVLLSATNQSMDSFDQAPAPSVLEERLIGALAALVGYPDGADGAFTSGGTQSNVTGLLLARDWYCDRRFDRSVQAAGLPPAADRLRILCSDAAHFTVDQAAHHLGLGEDAVVTVETDAGRRMDLTALDATLADLRDRDLDPFALVGTAGTTDFGSIDPLAALADRADEHDLWYHVDAAYGGACLLSDRLAPHLDGIDRADSVAVDFHKLCYQPISCGAFLLRDGTNYRYLDRNAAYLNPAADDAAGVPNLVGKSRQTSRRFDALKPYVTFQALGREGLADCVEYVCDLADAVAAAIRGADDLALLCDPQLSTVLFRYVPRDADTDSVNRTIRADLFADGEAVIARTTVDGTAALKLTLLDPTTTVDALRDVLAAVSRRGRAIEGEVAG